MDNNSLETYICNNCNCSFISSNKNICIYCGSNNISVTDSMDYSDYEVIPFNQSIDNVKKKYKSIIRYNYLLPFVFRKKSTYSKVKKIFIPAYLYNASIKGKISFIGADKIMKNQKYEILHDISIDFNNVIVSSCEKIDDSIISSINDYNYEMLKEYDDTLIKDSSILESNKSENDVRNIVLNKITNMALNTVKNNVNHDLKKLDYNDTAVDFSSVKKVLIPVYSISIKYKNKDYLFYMNGYTGNSNLDTTNSYLSMFILYFVLFILFLIITVGWSILF